MTGQIDQINDLISAIKQDEEKLDTKDLDAAVGAATTLALSRARDSLAFVVVVAYIAALCAVILFLGFKGLTGSVGVFDDMIEIIKVGFLPIVTLVIGFYFGTKSEQAKPERRD